MEKKSLIRAAILRWKPILGLERWDIKAEFVESAANVASCIAQPEYLTAVLSFNMDTVEDYTDQQVEETVVHELLHAVVWSLANPAGVGLNKRERKVMDYFEEETVSRLTGLFMALAGGLTNST